MIYSYGLFWREDQVFWGKPNKSGSLLGSASQSKKAISVDFREQRGIYALYADYDLIYIGQTGARNGDRLFNRLKTHTTDHLAERWNRFSWFGTEWVKKNHELSSEKDGVHEGIPDSLNILEAVVIAIAEPKLNLQRGKWSKTKKYFQFIDSNLS